MSRKIIVLMSAVIPTIGHRYLIDFARGLAVGLDDMVHVLVSSIKAEPVEGYKRVASLRIYFPEERVNIHHHHADGIPAEPIDDNGVVRPDFWKIWKHKIDPIESYVRRK